MDVEALLGTLSRLPDVEADNLQAFDATDRLLLDTAADLLGGPGTKVVVIGDRYGALTLGTLAGLGVGHVRVSQDLFTGRLALKRNAVVAGLEGRFTEYELNRDLLDGAGVVLLQLPKSLAELEEIADAVARFAAPDAVLLAGGRVKHMSLGMNEVLERYFSSVQRNLPGRNPGSWWHGTPPKRRPESVPFLWWSRCRSWESRCARMVLLSPAPVWT